MDIIFALDIKDGSIVQGNQGKRDTYLPPENKSFQLESIDLVIKKIINNFGINKFYIADLNAITKKGSNSSIINCLPNKFRNAEFYVDFGVYKLDDINLILKNGFRKAIIGLETLPNLKLLRRLYEKYGPHILFSLDIYKSNPINHNSEISNMKISDIVSLLKTYGAKEMIYLDIAKVGTQSGYNDKQLTLIEKLCNEIDVFIAGGLSSLNDICKLKEINAKGVILASLIYKNMVTNEEIKNLVR